MEAVLASAALIHTPGFAAPEPERRFIEDRRADFEANAKNLLYVALTRARDRLVLEWPGFLKERDEEAPEAKCLFHVFADACAPQIGGNTLRIGGIECPAIIRQLPEHAGFTEYLATEITDLPRLGGATPSAAVTLTPWRLQPSQSTTALPAPKSQGIGLGAPWPHSVSDAARGTAIHLALRTCLTRSDLTEALPKATGLDDATLALVAERAAALKAWLAAGGYTELRAEIPVLGNTADGAEISGTIDLLAVGPAGCLLIDHKSGGGGEGFGPYWPQLSAYATLVGNLYPQHPLQGVALFWIDHGLVELAVPEPTVAQNEPV
jgi:ATP-dependent exoDNAse (exonuclease V) beta subunit